MSVLILEDNRQILKVLEELVLSVSDEKVYATDDVGEAYKIAMENSVDVFLLDIILYADKKGDTSGMAVCAMCPHTGTVPLYTDYFYYFTGRPGNVRFTGSACIWLYRKAV